MQVTAVLHPHCAIVRDWRVRTVPSGTLFGVRFYRRGLSYASRPLDPDDLAKVERHPSVTVELTALAPAAPAVSPARAGKVRAEPKLISDDELFGGLDT